MPICYGVFRKINIYYFVIFDMVAMQTRYNTDPFSRETYIECAVYMERRGRISKILKGIYIEGAVAEATAPVIMPS
jgi:hypothetical protein